MVRPSTPDQVTDPAEVQAAIKAWQDRMREGLKAHLQAPFEWPDTPDSPYFTDKPGWDGYSALVLWAAHDQNPGHPLPAVAPSEWTKDSAYLAAVKEASEGRYSQLIGGPELWLPPSFPFVFQSQDPAGKTVDMGSIPELVEQLHDLNDRTWKASSADLIEWRRAGADFGAPLETSARFTHAVFSYCAEAALTHGLAVKLDY